MSLLSGVFDTVGWVSGNYEPLINHCLMVARSYFTERTINAFFAFVFVPVMAFSL